VTCPERHYRGAGRRDYHCDDANQRKSPCSPVGATVSARTACRGRPVIERSSRRTISVAAGGVLVTV
jgi:hypothetical protein